MAVARGMEERAGPAQIGLGAGTIFGYNPPGFAATRCEARFWSARSAMDKFNTLEGVAAPLKIINVDTDMIIPKQYLKTIKRTGLGKGCSRSSAITTTAATIPISC